MFSKKQSKPDQQGNASIEENKKVDNTMPLQERPWICLVDIDTNAIEALKSAGFKCTVSSFGSVIKLPNMNLGERRLCLLNRTMPFNLHEYDIAVVDLKDREPIQYNPSEHEIRDTKKAQQIFFECNFPQKLFDPSDLPRKIYPSKMRVERPKKEQDSHEATNARTNCTAIA